MVNSETVKVKALSVESSVYQLNKRTFMLEVQNESKIDIGLKQGTAICVDEICACDFKVIRDTSTEAVTGIAFMETESEVNKDKRILEYTTKAMEADFNEGKKELARLLYSFKDIMVVSGDSLGCTSIIEHRINLKANAGHIYIPSYRIP